MFNDASPGPWLVKGNVIYRIDKLKGGAEKKTEIARFRVFHIQGKTKLEGVSIEEAHDNAALVTDAVNLRLKVEDFITSVIEGVSDATMVKAAKKLRDEFFAKE